MDGAYTQARRRRAMPRHATPCHAVRIIKRNYCRAVVNNALLLKRVPATARGYFAPRRFLLGNRAPGIQTRVLSFAPRFIFRGWPWLDLALSWRFGRARESAVRNSRMAPAASRDLSSREGREKSYFGAFDRTAWYAMFRDRGIGAAVGASSCGKAIFVLTSLD